ncbi:unnamed protein product, partial [marine sediment metagenome]
KRFPKENKILYNKTNLILIKISYITVDLQTEKLLLGR